MNASVDPWKEYRKRRNLVLFAFLGYTPIVFVIGVVTIRLFHTSIPFYVAAFSWMIFYAVASLRCTSFRCPRCGKWLFANWWYDDGFARRWFHFGLPQYAPLTSEHAGATLTKGAPSMTSERIPRAKLSWNPSWKPKPLRFWSSSLDCAAACS